MIVTTTLDRAVGALVGLAAGDAVGTTLEFESPGTFEAISDMVGGGPFHLTAGQFTDDTSMALCLAESLLDCNGSVSTDQLRRYVQWWRAGYLSSTGKCFDIGVTTAAQLRRFSVSGEAVDPAPDPESAANGSLMRLAPVSIRWHTNVGAAVAMSAESSRTTHAAQRPVDCCRLFGGILAALIAGESFEVVTEPGWWRWGSLHPAVADIAAGTWKNKQPPAIRGTGYCIESLEAALWAVEGATDFRAAVLRAANLGNDADTTAAIAGQIAGARWGVSSLPSEWRGKLALGERVTSLATWLHVAAGSAIEDRWPFDATVHAWWVTPGMVLAGEYPGNVHVTTARLKLDLLVDAGIRTFVDLTTDADGLTPYDDTLAEVAADRRLDLRRAAFPIPDQSIIDDADYGPIIGAITGAQTRGGVYVHCWGGVGRTGTVVGCLLADDGLDDDSIGVKLEQLRRHTRKAGRACPENDSQRAVIRRRVEQKTNY